MADHLSSEPDDVYDIYGKTPPRTKILRKNRERNQRDKVKVGMASPKAGKAKASIGRRNTVSMLYDDLISKSENTDSDHGGVSKKTNKRNIKLLRGSERDLKLDIASAQAISGSKEVNGYQQTVTPQPSFHVESNNRFMSLSLRTIFCPKGKTIGLCTKSCDSKDEKKVEELPDPGGSDEASNIRADFYNTFRLLIRMRCRDNKTEDRNPRRILSREECPWQNDLKDVLWLELQAFHADRTTLEEDEYLCIARGFVDGLLKEIMDYQYIRHLKTYLSENSDSGVEEECQGCLSLFCVSCVDAQSDALREIGELSRRLDAAEALFPSSKAFAELFPLYSSPEFEARVKAIILWLNITKHQRLKLVLLGRFFSDSTSWPTLGSGKDKAYSETSSSASDSNNSTASTTSGYADFGKDVEYYNITSLLHLNNIAYGCKTSPYRKYIETMLKTRALHQSLKFLDNLHNYLLKKAQITLEKPDNNDIFQLNTFETEEEELRRYGSWSPEAQAIGLPSYRSSFLFLATVPLDVIHEYLLLRLEQKPENPSPLSIRQLMRELKEGLSVATTQRYRVEKYITIATTGSHQCVERYTEKLKSFDECVSRVFMDYLDYVEQWALLQHETFQKNLLESEWQYSQSIISYIPDGTNLLGDKFARILSSILESIKERLIVSIDPLIDTMSQGDDIKHNIFWTCRELQILLNEEREMSIKSMSFCKTICKYDLSADAKNMLKDAVTSFKCIIPQAIGRMQVIFEHANVLTLDESEKVGLMSRIREMLMQGYKFGFEFYKEMSDSKPHAEREKLARSMVQFANLWMKFVVEKCDRGRGMRPRWAFQGLEFLLTVCEPRNTKYLSHKEFEDLKRNMDQCISHVIGTTAPNTPESGFYSASPRGSVTRSRGSSPSPRPTYKSQRSASRKTSTEKTVSPTISDQVDSPNYDSRKSVIESIVQIKLPPVTHAERTKEAIEILENELDSRLRKQDLIGKLVACNDSGKSHIRQRYVNFTWQRGIKIGQGRFGKVYTAVNNSTGEMMAVKEIMLQHNDNLTIKRLSEEMKILEGISNRNLVKYYGVEVHKEEMLLFMEYCEEGTLESLVAATENGLSELLIRRYTYQLVSGVECLHDHGIVHRDIKPANIFMTEEGNCLKIGDFGCAIKIKFHTTMAGELKGFVGTQAYMAPEVFTRNMNEGHGRAADVWSVGCVVVEMASGKRPWAQFDSNYQIMFKVGMGQSPDPPDNMIDEGLDFLELCFKFNPKDRATAHELLDHNFVKIGEDL